MATNPAPKITEEEYLALDRAAEFRSEYINGEVFAMAGTSLNHFRIQRNISAELYNALRGSGCEAGGSDMRVRVSGRMYAYPDVLVICGRPVLADDLKDVLLNPFVIFEILSPSTAHYDRGPKFKQYRAIESLKEYVLVDQNQVLIERFSRQDSGVWTFRDYQSLDDELNIDTIGASVPLRRVYYQVEFPEQPDLA